MSHERVSEANLCISKRMCISNFVYLKAIILYCNPLDGLFYAQKQFLRNHYLTITTLDMYTN